MGKPEKRRALSGQWRFSLHTLVVFVSLYSSTSLAFVGTLSKLDDLYRMATKSSEFEGVSAQAFRSTLKSGKIARVAPLLKNFAKEDRLSLLLEIAKERSMISSTQQLRLAAKYSKLENGDELLLRAIDHGDTRLFDLLPKYGSELLSIEKSSPEAAITILRELGDEGWRVTQAIPPQQISRFASQSKSIASLENESRSKVLGAIARYPAKSLEYLDEHSSIVYKAAGVTGFLIFIDNLSKPTITIETQPDGTIIETRSGALSTAVFGSTYLTYLTWLIGLLFAGAILWGGIQVWGSWAKKRAELHMLKERDKK